MTRTGRPERPLMVRHFSSETLVVKDLQAILKQGGCRATNLTAGLQEVFRRYGFTTVLTDTAASQYLVAHTGALIENQQKGMALIPSLKTVFAGQPFIVFQHKRRLHEISLISDPGGKSKALERLDALLIQRPNHSRSAKKQDKALRLERKALESTRDVLEVFLAEAGRDAIRREPRNLDHYEIPRFLRDRDIV